LLKLKKLQILGFKSFCERTELKFHGDGIAAIVGPNGCGKSNLADAIAWVLGEQSAKTLRGSRMEDVIFAGSPDRKPTGMAEVALTLVDPEVYRGQDANEATEIEIQDELPDDDWDEAELRAQAVEEVDRLTEEAQPGRLEEVEAQPIEGAGSPASSPGASLTGEEAQTSAAADPATGSQVVLKIRRRRFQQQFRAGEIVVTRRLFRSGDSEYLLNGKLCRLRDIQELFMGTGLGSESYALIEQGRIGQILSSRPTDRRSVIEEAAGITKFKTKKRLAEARLEDAKQNLARVNDIFEEVTHHMNSLKRQASKAERYAKLREEMRAKLRLVLASKFAQLALEEIELEQQLNATSEQMREQNTKIQALEAEQTERRQRGYGIETEMRENRERLSQIQLEADRAQATRRHNDERCREFEARAAAEQAELAQIRTRFSSLEAERDANRGVLDSAAADLFAAQQELAACEQEIRAASDRLAALEHGQEDSHSAILEAVNSAANLQNQLTQAAERMAAIDRQTQRLRTEMANADFEVKAFGGERGQLALEFETVSERAARLSEQCVEARELLESKRYEESEAKHRLDSLRAEYASAMGKRSSLEAVIAEHGYSTESVRRLFQSGAFNGGLAPAGVLADFLEVEPRYEGVVEDFLRDELNYIVVKSWDAADEGLRLLRTDVDGRATFLVHPEDAQAKFSFAVDETANTATPDASIIPLKNSIRVLNGFGRSLEVILPKLRNGYIVPEPNLARELALENPDAFFLSQSGECFHNVTVTGGKQRQEGPLSMKRELRDLLRLLTELAASLRDEELRVLTLGRELKDLTSLLDRLEGEKRETEKQVMTSGHLLEQLDSEMGRAREQLDTAGKELEQLLRDRQEHESMIGSLQAELAQLKQKQNELEMLAASANRELASVRQERDRVAQQASQHVGRVAALEERHRSSAAGLERIESMMSEVTARSDSLARQIVSWADEKLQRETENQRMATLLNDLDAEGNACETREGLLQFESDQVRARLSLIDDQLREVRQELDQARDRRAELSASAAKLQSDAQYMAETCRNELGIERHQLAADTTIPMVRGEQLAAEDQAYREMRTRLEGMGPVNMMALEEYKETSERHAFLNTQRTDLIESIENTQATIREIDTFSRQKFEEAFHKINENFQATFKKLFGGGHAFMRLTDEENSAESGIDVVASPPGKKLQNVLLLSGGEKALTALALLVGIFRYQPSPFCILDEVDAPLDEANIGRFTELVKEMSIETQFVLITHSKKTMGIAPVLYGVTMQEPGVSKLVSVRFGATA
jgi:chromosome segregation protein